MQLRERMVASKVPGVESGIRFGGHEKHGRDHGPDGFRPGKRLRLAEAPSVEIAEEGLSDTDIDRLAVDGRSASLFFSAIY